MPYLPSSYRLTKTLYEGPGESVLDPALVPWLDQTVGAGTGSLIPADRPGKSEADH
jgi:hypothetical protein